MKVQTLLKNFLIIMILSFAFCAKGQEKKFTDYTFVELIEACDIIYKMPRGFNITPVIPDNGHFYQHAIKDSATGFEVRFYVRPYALFSTDTLLNSDKFTYSFFVTSVLDASGAVLPNYPPVEEFERSIIKEENNADYALNSSFNPNSRFGEGYKICIVLMLKKKGVGEITMFLLFNTVDREAEVIIGDITTCVKFK